MRNRCSFRRVFDCLGRAATAMYTISPSMDRLILMVGDYFELDHRLNAALFLAQAMYAKYQRRHIRSENKEYKREDRLVQGRLRFNAFMNSIPTQLDVLPNHANQLAESVKQEQLRKDIAEGVRGKQREWDENYGLVPYRRR